VLSEVVETVLFNRLSPAEQKFKPAHKPITNGINRLRQIWVNLIFFALSGNSRNMLSM
jgi:hypothetical protein